MGCRASYQIQCFAVAFFQPRRDLTGVDDESSAEEVDRVVREGSAKHFDCLRNSNGLGEDGGVYSYKAEPGKVMGSWNVLMNGGRPQSGGY